MEPAVFRVTTVSAVTPPCPRVGVYPYPYWVQCVWVRVWCSGFGLWCYLCGTLHPRLVRIPLMSGQKPVKPLPLLKVKVHLYRNALCPRNSRCGPPFVGLACHRHMVRPSHRLHCRARKRVIVHSSCASRNCLGVPIPGAIPTILGSIRAPLLHRFPALTVCDWSMKLKGD